METTTNMIVADAETIMLGGMLFQRNEAIQRKLPLLGDLPLAGALFRHYENVLANKELIVFITPYVVDDGEALSEKARERIEETRRKLDDVKNELNEDTERLKGDVEDVKAKSDPPAGRPKKRPAKPQQPAVTVASSKRPMPLDPVWR
jgi:type II secretory pathway component GspD/PulD (secretin)